MQDGYGLDLLPESETRHTAPFCWQTCTGPNKPVPFFFPHVVEQKPISDIALATQIFMPL